MRIRKWIAAIAAALLLTPLPLGAAAEETPDTLTWIQEILTYYQHYGEDAAADIEYRMAQLQEADPELAATWDTILTRWQQTDPDMPVTAGALPDGLPEDESLCIIVFGYKLNPDATMSNELLGRMRIALESARKYPNALIICSGGRTGTANRGISEAWLMYEYLVNRGVDRNRVIIENQAKSTTENVVKSFEILAKEHPEVKSVAFVASDYLIPRADFLLYAQSICTAAATGSEPIEILGYGAHDAWDPGTESVFSQAAGLAIIAGIDYDDYAALDKPVLSQLTRITLEGSTEYEFGGQPDFAVTAHYDSGITRDVTELSSFSEPDMHQEGTQTLTAEYTEGDVTVSAAITVTVAPEPTEAPTETQPAPTEETVPPEPAPQEEEKPSSAPVLIIAAVSAPLLFLTGWIQDKKNMG